MHKKNLDQYNQIAPDLRLAQLWMMAALQDVPIPFPALHDLRVLDLAAGAGTTALGYASSGADVVARVDTALEGQMVAERLSQNDAMAGSLHLPDPSAALGVVSFLDLVEKQQQTGEMDKFDLVFASSVVDRLEEHDIAKLGDHLARICKPGAALVMRYAVEPGASSDRSLRLLYDMAFVASWAQTNLKVEDEVGHVVEAVKAQVEPWLAQSHMLARISPELGAARASFEKMTVADFWRELCLGVPNPVDIGRFGLQMQKADWSGPLAVAPTRLARDALFTQEQLELLDGCAGQLQKERLADFLARRRWRDDLFVLGEKQAENFSGQNYVCRLHEFPDEPPVIYAGVNRFVLSREAVEELTQKYELEKWQEADQIADRIC